jgi:hypothetical protein
MRNRIIAIWGLIAVGIFLLCRFALDDVIYLSEHAPYRPLFRIVFACVMLLILVTIGIAATKFILSHDQLWSDDSAPSNPRRRRVWRNVKLALFAGVLGYLAVSFLRDRYFPPAKCSALNAAIAEMDRFKIAEGLYPTNPATMLSLQELQKRWKVYFGERIADGVKWSPYEVSVNDLTLLVDGTNMVCFAPVERMKSYSFSSFAVWRYTSEEHRWRRGRIHWSLGGTYWDEN